MQLKTHVLIVSPSGKDEAPVVERTRPVKRQHCPKAQRRAFPAVSLQAGFRLCATHPNHWRPPELFPFVQPGFPAPHKTSPSGSACAGVHSTRHAASTQKQVRRQRSDAEKQPLIYVSPWPPLAAASIPEEARRAARCQPQPALAHTSCRCFLFPLTSLATCSAVPHFYACPEEGRKLTLETQISLQLS